MRNFKSLAAVACVTMTAATTAVAAPINGTGNVTPDIIFGSGNSNGSFTGVTNNNIEVGLRGKQRYPAANVFNYPDTGGYLQFRHYSSYH